MEKILFALIAALLLSIGGIGFYAAVQNPRETASLVPAAVSAVQEATSDVVDTMAPSAQVSSDTSAVVSNGRKESEDESDRDDDDDDDRAAAPAPTPTTKPTTGATKTSPTPAAGTYTLAQVSTHNSASSCYTVVNGTVYDLTSFISQHPGGEQRILSICGKDGTSAFTQQHAGARKPEAELASHKIGTLAK